MIGLLVFRIVLGLMSILHHFHGRLRYGHVIKTSHIVSSRENYHCCSGFLKMNDDDDDHDNNGLHSLLSVRTAIELTYTCSEHFCVIGFIVLSSKIAVHKTESVSMVLLLELMHVGFTVQGE